MWQPALTTAGGTMGGTGRPNRAQLAIVDDGFTTLYTKNTLVPKRKEKVRVSGYWVLPAPCARLQGWTTSGYV